MDNTFHKNAPHITTTFAVQKVTGTKIHYGVHTDGRESAVMTVDRYGNYHGVEYYATNYMGANAILGPYIIFEYETSKVIKGTRKLFA